jgi:hypothetical protein
MLREAKAREGSAYPLRGRFSLERRAAPNRARPQHIEIAESPLYRIFGRIKLCYD